MQRTRVLAGVGFALALGGAATGGVVAASGSAAQKAPVVRVTEKEFRLVPSTRRLAPGKVTFVAVNKGKFPHALAVAGPGLKTRKTPVLAPGKSARLTVTLRAGTLNMWCPIGNHAALGMKLALHVAGPAPASADTTPPAAAATTTTPAESGGGGGGWG